MPYLTPSTLPAETICRELRIPNDPLILAAVNGALTALTEVQNWEQYGAVTPEEIAQAMALMYENYWREVDCTEVPDLTIRIQNIDGSVVIAAAVQLTADGPRVFDMGDGIARLRNFEHVYLQLDDQTINANADVKILNPPGGPLDATLQSWADLYNGSQADSFPTHEPGYFTLEAQIEFAHVVNLQSCEVWLYDLNSAQIIAAFGVIALTLAGATTSTVVQCVRTIYLPGASNLEIHVRARRTGGGTVNVIGAHSHFLLTWHSDPEHYFIP